ncbi:hypothetical protein [Streptomyces sp. NPDC056527]|uniref:hypothetical protein n=1 Tax=Streptomyces sp. NPDC056527 TaxID=3345853 RepID=UPI0036B98CC3
MEHSTRQLVRCRRPGRGRGHSATEPLTLFARGSWGLDFAGRLSIDADAAEIACVFRQYVPGSIEVIFCNQAFNVDLVITPDTTPAELIGKVDALP